MSCAPAWLRVPLFIAALNSSIGPAKLGNAVTNPVAASLNPIAPVEPASKNAAATSCPALPPIAANPVANTSIPATTSLRMVSLMPSIDALNNPLSLINESTKFSNSSVLTPSALA